MKMSNSTVKTSLFVNVVCLNISRLGIIRQMQLDFSYRKGELLTRYLSLQEHIIENELNQTISNQLETTLDEISFALLNLEHAIDALLLNEAELLKTLTV
jgi:hypothetical protein